MRLERNPNGGFAQRVEIENQNETLAQKIVDPLKRRKPSESFQGQYDRRRSFFFLNLSVNCSKETESRKKRNERQRLERFEC